MALRSMGMKNRALKTAPTAAPSLSCPLQGFTVYSAFQGWLQKYDVMQK